MSLFLASLNSKDLCCRKHCLCSCCMKNPLAVQRIYLQSKNKNDSRSPLAMCSLNILFPSTHTNKLLCCFVSPFCIHTLLDSTVCFQFYKHCLWSRYPAGPTKDGRNTGHQLNKFLAEGLSRHICTQPNEKNS